MRVGGDLSSTNVHRGEFCQQMAAMSSSRTGEIDTDLHLTGGIASYQICNALCQINLKGYWI